MQLAVLLKANVPSAIFSWNLESNYLSKILFVAGSERLDRKTKFHYQRLGKHLKISRINLHVLQTMTTLKKIEGVQGKYRNPA